MPSFLMSPPDYYGVEYEINPWMDLHREVSRPLAVSQWKALYDTLLSIKNVRVELVTPRQGLPDMVFTANAGLVTGRKFISSRFRPPERRGETPQYEQWFGEQGYEVVELPKEVFFEGEGDALRSGDTWYEGYYYRSDSQAHAALSEILAREVLPLRLVDPYYYHLDTCFCPLSDQSAVIYPAAFDEYALSTLKSRFSDLIEVSEDEARRFCCNSIPVGETVIMPIGCPMLSGELRSRCYDTRALDFSEFIKAGGAAKCLVLRLAAYDEASG
jgi:N-dimethylarginine dimethylaminohydrolase